MNDQIPTKAPLLDHPHPWAGLALLFIAAIALRHFIAANTDVTWLLTDGEKVLDGQRLYRDLIEINPPIAVFAFVPGIALARALGLSPDRVVDALAFLAIAASLVAAAALCRRAGIGLVKGWFLAFVSTAALTILPMQNFAQREHLACAAFLPALAVFAARSLGRTVPPWGIVVAGLGGGLMLMFKPYFIVAAAGAIVVAAVCARSWRVLFAPENFIIAGIVCAYAAVTIVLFPDYLTHILPLVRDVYLLPGLAPLDLAVEPGPLIWATALLAAAALRAPDRLDPPLLVTVAASAGFAVAFFLQRRGWAYQAYPMITLAMIALAYVLASRQSRSRVHDRVGIAGAAVLVVTFACGLLWLNAGPDRRELEAAVRRYGAHPRIFVFSGEPSIGYPLVRNVGGVWVSQQQALWIQGYADWLQQHNVPFDAQKLARYQAEERMRTIDAITRQAPDIILVDTDPDEGWVARLRDDQQLAALLSAYRYVEKVGEIEILYASNRPGRPPG